MHDSRSSRRRGVLIVLALLLGALGACRNEPWQPRRVFLITVDTLRADHLGIYGYPRATSPSIDRLGRRGVTFERAIAQWPKTGPSFASMFTGQYPQTTGLTHRAAQQLPDAYLSLPELMSESGFTTVAVVSNAVLSRELGWDQGFGEYLQTWDLAPEMSEDPAEYRQWIEAARVNELAEPLLEKYRDAERLFVWLHYSDPHAPYLLPDGVDNPFLGDEHYSGTEEATFERRRRRATAIGDHKELRYYVAQYDANVLYTDGRIDAILRHAGRLGLLDHSLLAFTADHGESLGEHGYFFGHGRLPYNNGSHVPLVLVRFDEGKKPPTGHRVSTPVELIDLFPTFAELIGSPLEIPDLEGKSLVPLLSPEGESRPSRPPRFELAFSQAGEGGTHFRSVQDRQWKLIYHPEGKKVLESYELYHLREDPAETRNLVDEAPEELRRLHRVLFGWMKGSDWIRRPREEIQEQNERTLKALRALGYVT